LEIINREIMKKIFILLLFIGIGNFAFSQILNKRITDTLSIERTRESTVIDQGNKAPIFSTFLIMGEHDAIEERFIRKNEAIKLYGIERGYDLLYEKLRPDLKLISLEQLLKIYNIKPEDWNLRVFVNMQMINYPKKLIAVESEIVAVKVVTFNNKNIINIITAHPRKDNPIH
jgi:hypothetical protein